MWLLWLKFLARAYIIPVTLLDNFKTLENIWKETSNDFQLYFNILTECLFITSEPTFRQVGNEVIKCYSTLTIWQNTIKHCRTWSCIHNAIWIKLHLQFWIILDNLTQKNNIIALPTWISLYHRWSGCLILVWHFVVVWIFWYWYIVFIFFQCLKR